MPWAGRVRSCSPPSIVRLPGSGLCAPRRPPPGSWAANTSGPACPAGMSCRVRQPASPPLPYRLPAPEPAPPSPAHRGSGPASTPHWHRHAPAPGFPIPPRAAPPLPDTLRHSLWRRCAGLNPSPAGSARARSSTSRTRLPCPLARPAASLPCPACPWRLRPTAPSVPYRPSEKPTGSGSASRSSLSSLRSSACLYTASASSSRLRARVGDAEVEIVVHVVRLQAQRLAIFLQCLFPVSQDWP